MRSIMSDLCLKLVNTGSSHYTTSNTWIETIYVDESNSVIIYDRFLPTFPSKHDIITATIDVLPIDNT